MVVGGDGRLWLCSRSQIWVRERFESGDGNDGVVWQQRWQCGDGGMFVIERESRERKRLKSILKCFFLVFILLVTKGRQYYQIIDFLPWP